MLASVIEAVIGACYLHAGYERTAEAVVEAFAPEIEEALEHPVDFKSALQELLARRGEEVSYAVTDEEGPPHERTYTVVARVGGASWAAGAAAARSTPSRTPPARPSRGSRHRGAHAPEVAHAEGLQVLSRSHAAGLRPGVSVVVGPNGSGKSNVTDAVLWAMGEQSPLAVRGQSMQDVIFGGGHGVQARSAAEVEIVLDNSDGTVDLPLSEISIVRRLDRTGEGGYRLNGARCRLTDVIEVLSDTGLGKETHSVISQGRVEAIVTSKPRDRRLLIEEAAGLGKHRKRRRRAQLKLERTQENLDRALDVEREARTRLRPLKRQAEAAELHERLEHQTLQARWELAKDPPQACTERSSRAPESRVADARKARGEIESRLELTIERRGRARARAVRARRAPRRAVQARHTRRSAQRAPGIARASRSARACRRWRGASSASSRS